jgi:hypothetical protein
MSDYDRHAYRRTILSDIQKYVLENFIDSDTPRKKDLVCEEVFFANSNVPQEAFLEVMERKPSLR